MSSRNRLPRALAATVALGLLASMAGPAVAGAASTAPPTTVNPIQDLLNKLLAPPTVPKPPPTTAAPAARAGGPTTTVAKPGGPTTTTTVPHVVPPDAQRLINSIRRTGGRTTGPLLTALAQLVDLGLSPQEAAVVGMGHFPVGGEAGYNDDFLMPRFTGAFHLHQGNDIAAARGTPIRASNDGIVRFGSDTLGGNNYILTLPDGTYYYGAHLASYAKIPSGSKVTQGQIIAYVGDSGDATGFPHLHFEIHPKGGAAVNPKPILDAWLDEAAANVANILASYQVGVPRAIMDAGILRRFDEPVADGSDASVLLAASSAGSGSVRLTELRASRSLADRSKADAAALDAWKAAESIAKAVLAPVTPRMLQAVLVPSGS